MEVARDPPPSPREVSGRAPFAAVASFTPNLLIGRFRIRRTLITLTMLSLALLIFLNAMRRIDTQCLPRAYQNKRLHSSQNPRDAMCAFIV